MSRHVYSVNVINSCPEIYIDTSSIMRYEEFQQFVNIYADVLLEQGRKIHVTDEVFFELIRISSSDIDANKAEKARRGLEILSDYAELFDVNRCDATDEQLKKAFADTNILTQLLINRQNVNQLVITNDKGLSDDAFGLNQLKCSIGHRVFACYITKNGNLKASDCVGKKTEKEQKVVDMRLLSKKSTSETAHETIKQTKRTENESKNSREKYWVTFGGFAVGGITGACAHKYWPQIKTVINMILK